MTLPRNTIWQQNNDGDLFGDIKASFNIDLIANRGKVRTSPQTMQAISTTDDGDLDNIVTGFANFNAYYWAIADVIFRVSNTDPTGTWAQDTSTNSPTVTTQNLFSPDLFVFNNKLYALSYAASPSGIQVADIWEHDGSAWSSWWVTDRSQTKLSYPDIYVGVGPDKNLYIVNQGDKVYKVTPSETVSTSGDGTLDFSSQPWNIKCMAFTSTRMWLGYHNTVDDTGGVIEWDMSATSQTANRIHAIREGRIDCIFIWNDQPWAIAGNGAIMRFTGDGFIKSDYQFPIASSNAIRANDFVCHNGWAIIDGYPHILVKGEMDTTGSAYEDVTADEWSMPSGVYCLDPKIGLFHRFSLSGDSDNSNDFGQVSLSGAGALYKVVHANTKFLAGYQYYSNSTTEISAIAYHDNTNSIASRAFLVTTPQTEMKNLLALAHKKLATGEEIRVYSRSDLNDAVVLDGTWSDTTHFHTTDTTTNVSKGDVLIIKTGQGAGTVHRISAKDTSTATTVLTVAEAVSQITAPHANTVEVLNFRRVGEITTSKRDINELSIPYSDQARHRQYLIEFRQAASNVMELDSVII